MTILQEKQQAATLKQNGNYVKYFYKSKYVPKIEDEKHARLAAGEFTLDEEGFIPKEMDV